MPDTALPHISTGSSGLADLGARMRADWRADEEMWMRAAARQWAHRRTIADVVREFGARGDRIAIEAAGRSFDGVVIAVGDDRVDLRTACSIVTVRTAMGDEPSAVRAPIVLRRSVVAPAGGHRLPSAPATFRARLRELEAAGEPVRLGTFLTDAEYAGVVAVAQDHVVVRGDCEVVLPECWIGYVVAPPGLGS